MANEKRLIDANALQRLLLPIAIGLENEYGCLGGAVSGVMKHIDNAPTVDAYTEEQVESLVKKVKQLEIDNQELETEYAWLKSCLNCKIRRECPRHCGKVVHDCDHWVYGDNVVHGHWEKGNKANWQMPLCSACKAQATARYAYCPKCGAKMDGDGNG